MWILSTYVTSKGEGREGGERRGEQTMNRDKEKAERERVQKDILTQSWSACSTECERQRM